MNYLTTTPSDLVRQSAYELRFFRLTGRIGGQLRRYVRRPLILLPSPAAMSVAAEPIVSFAECGGEPILGLTKSVIRIPPAIAPKLVPVPHLAHKPEEMSHMSSRLWALKQAQVAIKELMPSCAIAFGYSSASYLVASNAYLRGLPAYVVHTDSIDIDGVDEGDDLADRAVLDAMAEAHIVFSESQQIALINRRVPKSRIRLVRRIKEALQKVCIP